MIANRKPKATLTAPAGRLYCAPSEFCFPGFPKVIALAHVNISLLLAGTLPSVIFFLTLKRPCKWGLPI